LPVPPTSPQDTSRENEGRSPSAQGGRISTTSLRDLIDILSRRRRFVGLVVIGLLLLCLVYCFTAPRQYEASAIVALRQGPASSLNLDGVEPLASASILSAPLQLETLANVFRSDQLAWRVILELGLYKAAGFDGDFAQRFPGFHPGPLSSDGSDAPAQAFLLARFQKRLHVQTLPRTLLIQIRFRSNDPALSAATVNTLIRAYSEQDTESRVNATNQSSDWLQSQLKEMKTRLDTEQKRLTDYEDANGILSTPETLDNNQSAETQHSATLLEVDELGRQLVAATTDRIQREAEFRAASQGDPELVIASDTSLQDQGASFATALLQQIHASHSALELEQAQLSAEHGPNFPRVVEISRQLADLDRQKKTEDARLVGRFQSAWQTAADREQLVRKSLEKLTGEGLKENEAASGYAAMRQEANSTHDVYMQLKEKVDEAGMVAGTHGANISVVDFAREPMKPVTPDTPLYLAIALFVGVWLAVGGALLVEALSGSTLRAAAAVLLVVVAASLAQGQAPTPNTAGLPSGVVKFPPTPANKNLPNPQESPAVWNSAAGPGQAGQPDGAQLSESPMAAPIGPGDSLDIAEYHTPEFHSAVRVSPMGTITLPMVMEVKVGGMDEEGAAHAIEAALLAKGMLLHPQVSVTVTAYAGQDVSVLGEVARPGVYAYTVHHRLLDLISAASGLSPNAGRLVNIFYRSDPRTPHPVVMDPSGTDTETDHNPELSPGDTVQVSRAGLVYVIGDVVRPGGFPVDPAQGLTVVQALSLAWGQSQNAASKALLIREQKGGRTLTTLNLRRMIHGQEPDQPVHDRDILFVPDSMAKNLWNKSVEAAIQSAIGVTIYAGLVYSQRF
jgi:polysaccharide export outer membrane protein